jgi:hypothetical protein
LEKKGWFLWGKDCKKIYIIFIKKNRRREEREGVLKREE